MSQQRLFMPYRTLQKDGSTLETFRERERTDTLQKPSGNKMPIVLISSSEGSPAKTSASPDPEQASPASGQDSSLSSHASPTSRDPESFSQRTWEASSRPTADEISESFSGRWPTSGMAWRGGLSTHSSSECPSDGDGCSCVPSTLEDVLEQNVPQKYSLSVRAASGILRRAERRQRALPDDLRVALEAIVSRRP